MEAMGINSNVHAGGKIFHIQTAADPARSMFQAEIFEKGRVIMVQKKNVDASRMKDWDKDKIKDFLNEFHQEIAWEIELLFFIRDKIKTIKHAVSHNKMGLIFLRKGMVEEAIVEFENAIEKNPGLVESYNNLGLAYMQSGDHTKAIEILQKGCEMEPQFADLKNNLGMAYSKACMFTHALSAYEAALAINPKYAEAHLNSVITLLESNMAKTNTEGLPPVAARKATILHVLEKVIASNPDFTNFRFYSFRFEKLIKQIESGETIQAIETINEIKDAIGKPNLDEIMHGFYLKFLFGGAGKNESILEQYRIKLEKAVETNPNYADLHNSLGLLFLIQCRNLFLKAMMQFKKAYEINPSYKSAYKNFRLVHNDGREFLNLLRAIIK
ncbi:tetratricopeptide repeat protein [bacterium]|nr:MAG: tetratricopeptide repeat protein [bacterium]